MTLPAVMELGKGVAPVSRSTSFTLAAAVA
jgi:hypothetical protein